MNQTTKRFSYIVTWRREAEDDDCESEAGPWQSSAREVKASDDETARRMLMNEYFSKGRQVRTIDEVRA